MKKKNLKSLKLNKKNISNLKNNELVGGTELTLFNGDCPQGVYSIPEPGNPICPTITQNCL